ncbi:MAG: hypothetical protein SGPRY_009293, partial [Prymnesium sp.]
FALSLLRKLLRQACSSLGLNQLSARLFYLLPRSLLLFSQDVLALLLQMSLPARSFHERSFA